MKNFIKNFKKRRDLERADIEYKKLIPHKQRIDDIYLVSYPKSGNGWISFLISNVIIKYLNVHVHVNFFNSLDFINDIHMSRAVPDELLYYPFRRIIKSHGSFNPYYLNTFLIMRNPKDVMISYYKYLATSKRYFGSFKKFIKDEKFGIEAWRNHTLSWIDKGYTYNKLIIFYYEDFKKSPQEQLHRMFQLMGFDISDEILNYAVEKSSFSNMQLLETQTNTYYAKQFKNFQFVRKGEVEQKEDFIDSECIDIIKSNISKIEIKLGKKFKID